MQLKRRVALNGVQLDSIDSRICINSVEPGDGKENISAVDSAVGFGSRITGARRSTVDMIVKFQIREKGRSTSGLQARAEVIEKVNAWAAGGGKLTVNYKPDRRLNVVLAQAPGEGSLWDYTKEFQIVFRAYDIPYWEKDEAETKTFGGSDTTGGETATVGGSAVTQMNATIENTGTGTVNGLELDVGERVMVFADLGLGVGEKLVIDHTSDGLVRIRIRSTGGTYRSAMAKRTIESADDLLVGPGNQILYFAADDNCEVTVSWRNRYL